jgi:hypothetical protein
MESPRSSSVCVFIYGKWVKESKVGEMKVERKDDSEKQRDRIRMWLGSGDKQKNLLFYAVQNFQQMLIRGGR